MLDTLQRLSRVFGKLDFGKFTVLIWRLVLLISNFRIRTKSKRRTILKDKVMTVKSSGFFRLNYQLKFRPFVNYQTS